MSADRSMRMQIREWLNTRRDLSPARRYASVFVLIVLILGIWGLLRMERGPDVLLNVSYDASREYFAAINDAWEARPSSAQEEEFRTQTLHAGSVGQAQAVSEGLAADVVSLASAAEIDLIVRRTGHIRSDWRSVFPHGSSPVTSTIVFLVRSQNPKGIRDWSDLIRGEVAMAAPSPRVSGAGLYAWLAADIFTRENPGRQLHVERIFDRAILIELGARRAADVFVRDSRADVFLTWESEALRLTSEPNAQLEIVYPSVSVLAEPVVAVIDHHVEKRGTRAAAMDYLHFLFSDAGQQLAAANGLRPRIRLEESSASFPDLRLMSVQDIYGSWDVAWQTHFSNDGAFERFMRMRIARRRGAE